MRLLAFVFGLLLLDALPARSQTILQCYNSAPGFATTQPCPGNKSTTNNSKKITTGSTYQTILAAATNRASLTIENNNASDTCYLIIGTTQIVPGTTTTNSNITIAGSTVTAAQASITLLAPGGSYQRYFPYVPADIIYGTCATTGDSIYVDVQ